MNELAVTWQNAGWLVCCVVSIAAGAVFLRYYVLQQRRTRDLMRGCDMAHNAMRAEQAAHKDTRQRLWAMIIKLRTRIKELTTWDDSNMDTQVREDLRLTQVIHPLAAVKKPPPLE